MESHLCKAHLPKASSKPIVFSCFAWFSTFKTEVSQQIRHGNFLIERNWEKGRLDRARVITPELQGGKKTTPAVLPGHSGSVSFISGAREGHLQNSCTLLQTLVNILLSDRCSAVAETFCASLPFHSVKQQGWVCQEQRSRTKIQDFSSQTQSPDLKSPCCSWQCLHSQ